MKEKIIKGLQLFAPLILGGLVGFIINSSMDYTSLNQPPIISSKYHFPDCMVDSLFINGNQLLFIPQRI